MVTLQAKSYELDARAFIDNPGHDDLRRMTSEIVVIGTLLTLSIGLAIVFAYRRGRDVRRRAEADLQASRLKHQLIVEALPIVTYSASASGDFGALWVSENIEAVSGFPPSAFLTDSGLWVSRIHPDDKAQALQEFERLHQTGTLSSEYRWQTADGAYHWFQDRAVLCRDRDTKRLRHFYNGLVLGP